MSFPVLKSKLEPLFELRAVTRRPNAPFDPWAMLATDRITGTSHEIVACLVKGRDDPIGAAERRIASWLEVIAESPRLFVPIDDGFVVPAGASRAQGTSVLITPCEPRFAASVTDFIEGSVSIGLSGKDACDLYAVIADAVLGALVAAHRRGVVHGNLKAACVRIPRCATLRETAMIVKGTRQCRLGGISVGTLPQGATTAADWRAAEELLIALAASAPLAHVSSRCISYCLSAVADAKAGHARWASRVVGLQQRSTAAPAAPETVAAPAAAAPLDVQVAQPPASATRNVLPSVRTGPPLRSADAEKASPAAVVVSHREELTAPAQGHGLPPTRNEEDTVLTATDDALVPCPTPPVHAAYEGTRDPSIGTSTATRASSAGQSEHRSASPLPPPDGESPALMAQMAQSPLAQSPDGESVALATLGNDANASTPRQEPSGGRSLERSGTSSWSPDSAASPDAFTKRLQQMVSDISAMSPACRPPQPHLLHLREETLIYDDDLLHHDEHGATTATFGSPSSSPPRGPGSPRCRGAGSPFGAWQHPARGGSVNAVGGLGDGPGGAFGRGGGVLAYVAQYMSPARIRPAAVAGFSDGVDPSSPPHVSALQQDQQHAPVAQTPPAARVATPPLHVTSSEGTQTGVLDKNVDPEQMRAQPCCIAM
jgi:hypothetical protein